MATNHKEMQISVLGFMQQVEFFKGIKTIRKRWINNLPLKITTELIAFARGLWQTDWSRVYTQSQICENMYATAHTFWAYKHTEM